MNKNYIVAKKRIQNVNIQLDKRFTSHFMKLNSRMIPVIKKKYDFLSRLCDAGVRFGIGRKNYAVVPGLYAIGNPNADSPVMVTANYLLTINKIRKVPGLDAVWVLVLDTKGVNVWCAASKGTFGTQEVLRMIQATHLDTFVNHRTLILPQLGAPGVNAHTVQKESGFHVVYGPVRIEDLPHYLNDGYKKDSQMRTVTFTLFERFEVMPLELIFGMKYILPVLTVLIVYGVLANDFADAVYAGIIPFMTGILSGIVLFPVLVPLLPGKFFSTKGIFIGLITGLIAWSVSGCYYDLPVYLLVTIPVTGFLALNFTGSTPFTNVSGVKVEVKLFSPVFIISIILGTIYTAIRLVFI